MILERVQVRRQKPAMCAVSGTVTDTLSAAPVHTQPSPQADPLQAFWPTVRMTS